MSLFKKYNQILAKQSLEISNFSTLSPINSQTQKEGITDNVEVSYIQKNNASLMQRQVSKCQQMVVFKHQQPKKHHNQNQVVHNQKQINDLNNDKIYEKLLRLQQNWIKKQEQIQLYVETLQKSIINKDSVIERYNIQRQKLLFEIEQLSNFKQNILYKLSQVHNDVKLLFNQKSDLNTQYLNKNINRQKMNNRSAQKVHKQNRNDNQQNLQKLLQTKLMSRLQNLIREIYFKQNQKNTNRFNQQVSGSEQMQEYIFNHKQRQAINQRCSRNKLEVGRNINKDNSICQQKQEQSIKQRQIRVTTSTDDTNLDNLNKKQLYLLEAQQSQSRNINKDKNHSHKKYKSNKNIIIHKQDIMPNQTKHHNSIKSQLTNSVSQKQINPNRQTDNDQHQKLTLNKNNQGKQEFQKIKRNQNSKFKIDSLSISINHQNQKTYQNSPQDYSLTSSLVSQLAYSQDFIDKNIQNNQQIQANLQPIRHENVSRNQYNKYSLVYSTQKSINNHKQCGTQKQLDFQKQLNYQKQNKGKSGNRMNDDIISQNIDQNTRLKKSFKKKTIFGQQSSTKNDQFAQQLQNQNLTKNKVNQLNNKEAIQQNRKDAASPILFPNNSKQFINKSNQKDNCKTATKKPIYLAVNQTPHNQYQTFGQSKQNNPETKCNSFQMSSSGNNFFNFNIHQNQRSIDESFEKNLPSKYLQMSWQHKNDDDFKRYDDKILEELQSKGQNKDRGQNMNFNMSINIQRMRFQNQTLKSYNNVLQKHNRLGSKTQKLMQKFKTQNISILNKIKSKKSIV